jgi:hypothetical protein
MEESKTELILVYNADSGLFNIIKDSLHKSVSPSTYKCNLCSLTYGTIHMKSKWKTFIDKLKIPAEFLHRDEFFRMLKTHPHRVENARFPAIYLHRKGKLSLLITSNEINRCKTLEDLIYLVDEKLASAQ